METRHPVQGSFGSDVWAICNHCIVIVAWSRKTLKFCDKFLHCMENRPLMVKFSKFCSESFHHNTDRRRCVQISWNLADGKSVKSCIIHLIKKISPDSQTVATAQIAPEICQGQPPTMCSECSRFNTNQFIFGGVIAERVNTAKSPHKVNPIFGRSLALSRIIIKWLVFSLMFSTKRSISNVLTRGRLSKFYSAGCEWWRIQLEAKHNHLWAGTNCRQMTSVINRGLSQKGIVYHCIHIIVEPTSDRCFTIH